MKITEYKLFKNMVNLDFEAAQKYCWSHISEVYNDIGIVKHLHRLSIKQHDYIREAARELIYD